eukprot:SM000177S03194  [mRNA]  locus=s177:293522:299055:+ [translate_table: standard]
MAQMPALDGAPINLASLRDHARRELVDALDSTGKKKALVLDPKLSGQLALVAQTSLLKEHGVENLYHLSQTQIQTDCKVIVFLVRPRLALMNMVARQIKLDLQQRISREYALFFTPRRTIVCEKLLEEEGVYADLTIGEYPLDLIAFDEDVLSLEYEGGYKECQLDGDRSSLFYIARALMRLQGVFGTIPHVMGKGRAAAQLADLLKRMQREQQGGMPLIAPEIDLLILLDRQVDLVTPMCTQLTYEGLIDEVLQINNCSIEVDPVVMGGQAGAKRVKIPLTSNDKLFQELRNLNFGLVGQILRQKAASMKQDYAEVTTSNQSVSDLKDFVKKLNSLPEMTRHTNLAQHLGSLTFQEPSFRGRLSIEQTLVEGHNYDAAFEFVEELIARQSPLLIVLRMACLLSLTNGGLPKKQYDFLRREILHSYGFEHLGTLDNLEKAGLLKKQDVRGSWAIVRKGLKLVIDDLDDLRPQDIAYTFSGYAPISIRLVQQALRPDGWRAIDEVMRALPGPSFDRKQLSEAEKNTRDSETKRPDSEGDVRDTRRKLVMVVFLGGVTFAEIAALRFLSAQEHARHDFLIATTKLINGSSLLSTLVDLPGVPAR